MSHFNKAISLYLRQQIAKILFIIIAVVILPFDVSSQTTITLGSSKDNTLYEDVSGSISNGKGDHFFSGKTSQGIIRRGLIAFDIAGVIPGCATITSVSLTLHMSKTISGNENTQLRKVNQNWGEGNSDALGDEGGGVPADTNDATWLHTFYNTSLWSTTGGSFSSSVSDSIPVGGNGFYTWGSNAAMINDVQSWLNNPSTNFGWIILGNEISGPSAKRFDTRENDSVNFRPKLNITYTSNSLALNLTALIEGFWNGNTMVRDTVTVFLRNTTTPFAKVDSAKVRLDSLGKGVFCFANAVAGSYYVVVTHRNSIETWSKLPQTFAIGVSRSYDFTTSADKAFGDNLKLKLGKYTNYSGDVNQDGIMDASDLSLIDNAAFTSTTGYVRTDLNGDNFVDGSDLSIADNNVFIGVIRRRP